MRKAIYAFSGDPVTFGHIDIVERASKAFDEVIVGIGVNPDKKYMFSEEERKEMAEKALAKFNNVKVVSFRGLLVDYAYENGIDTIVKGVRNAADFDYENILHQIGESQKLGIDTHILFAKPELAHISSSNVKAIQKEQGMIHKYVPLNVKQRLEDRISGQFIVGITGEIGAGKSYVSNKFAELGKSKGIEVHNIELDNIGHSILSELKEPRYDEIRKQIADAFGQKVRKQDGTIDRKILGELVFNDAAALNALNEIMDKPLLMRLRRSMYGAKGLILLNAALISESNMGYMCNNNVVLVHADKAVQESRLKARGLNQEQIQRRLKSQLDFDGKKKNLEKTIELNNNGKIWCLDNTHSSDKEIEKTFNDVVSELKVI